MIGILDYGLGNLRSVQKAFEYLGERVTVSPEEKELDGCGRLVLPGVGSFRAGMEALVQTGLDEYLRKRASDTPILGICLGMQLLLDMSEEGGCGGLSLIPGRVVRFTVGKIPHMGWNGVNGRGALFAGIGCGEPFYFVHSYFAQVGKEYEIGTTEYHAEFASAIGRDTLFGVQFHPEKSGEAGLRLLKNFCKV